MDRTKKQLWTARSAQAAIELAVFGAILIFVIGMIIKQALQTSYWQNQNLKAMRLAMKTSYESMEQESGTHDIASRRSATVLFIEDRLTADSAKYGSVDRTPHMVQGSATHNTNVFMPVDFGSCDDLPVMDVIVNGKHFVFTTAGFRTVSFPIGPSSGGMTTITATKTDPCGGAANTSATVEWDPGCATTGGEVTSECTSGDCDWFCPNFDGGCADGPIPTTDPDSVPSTPVGCANFYTIVANHPLIEEWCDDTTGGRPCPVSGDSDYNLTADERFDLDRGLTNLNEGGTATPSVSEAERPYLDWQWYLVRSLQSVDNGATFGQSVDSGATLVNNKGAQIVLTDEESENTSVDVDGDLKLEGVMKDTIVTNGDGIITSLGVMDMNDGDVDFDFSQENDIRQQPAFTKEVAMYTFVRDRARGVTGTYFKVEEGKLFSATGDQFIRTARKKDQVDLIERVFRLSNDTGRYCSGGTPTAWGSTAATKGEGDMGFTNPVEACGDCFTSANISKTCMDTTNLLIFVRSRIEDLRGRKWVTDTSGDPYVDFMSPSGY